jgi:hypothetical protein
MFYSKCSCTELIPTYRVVIVLKVETCASPMIGYGGNMATKLHCVGNFSMIRLIDIPAIQGLGVLDIRIWDGTCAAL